MTIELGIFGHTLPILVKEAIKHNFKTKNITLNTPSIPILKCDFCNIYHDVNTSCKKRQFILYKYLTFYFKKKTIFFKKKKTKYNFYKRRSIYANPFNKKHWRQK